METLDKVVEVKKVFNNSKLPSINLNGYRIFSGGLQQISFSEKTLINTINQNAYCVAEIEDKLFKDSLQNSDILLPDGIGIVIAVRFLFGIKIRKIAGYNLHNYLLKQLNQKGGSCFYLGSSESNLKKITNRLQSEYPNIKVGCFSPPYKAVFSEEDNRQMLSILNTFKPDVLFIGMTAPKQENWAYTHKQQINANLICSIGAAFDFFAGTIKRPSKTWQKLGLEWFVRLVKEPKRMSRRYLYYGPVFIFILIKLKFKMLFNKNKFAGSYSEM